jgi:hypothetical protein
VRCGRCGNENAEGYRFCGMCGAALVAKDQAGQAGSSPDAGGGTGQHTGPVITGHSFLGLNAPAPEKDTRRAGLQGDQVADRGVHDPLRPSSNVDYLLDDVDEPRRGWGKVILVVVALALAVGFGYLHWKRGGFDWVNAGDKKPAAATAQTPEAGQSGADFGVATPAATPGGTAPQAGSGTTAAAGGSAGPEESGAGQTTPAQTASQATPSQSAPPSATASQSTDQPGTPQSNAGDSSTPASGAQAASADSDKSPAAEVTPKAVVRKPAATKPTAAKPTAAKPPASKPPAAKPVDSVTEAERYIYGRGAGQDCDRGLRLLKPAAEQSNVKAMVSLGALYSTGTCTPRDLPTAYRWFALALHKEPDNQALQNDLQSLWGKMTPPERQLAIKLSQ